MRTLVVLPLRMFAGALDIRSGGLKTGHALACPRVPQ